MRRLYAVLILLAAYPAAVFAQTELRHSGDTLGVSANGREVVTITNKGNNSLCLNVAGFTLDLEAHKKQRVSRNSLSIGAPRLGFIGLTKPDYSMYDDGVSNFLELDNAKSIHFSFIVGTTIMSKSDRTWITIGVSPTWNNYVFNDRITPERIGGMVQPVPLDMDRLKKSKLTTFSLDVPIMFGFEPVRKLSIDIGAYGGFTLKSHTKVKFPTSKDRGDFGVNFFKAGATLRVKYSFIGVFVDYSFTPLFKSGAGPRTNPFIIGITL